MFAYIARRVAYVIPISLGVTIFIFGLVHIAPGDPLNAVVPPDAPQETVEILVKAYGLDQPIPVQYFMWLGRALEGDFGISFATGRPVAEAIAGGVVNTLVLAAGAILIGMTLGCLIGALAGYFQGSWIDKLATGFAIAGVSVPHYWLGLVLVIIFSVEMNALPAMGMGPGGSREWVWDAEHMRHLILPVITLSVIPIGIITRSVRATVAEILTMEFVQTLEAKGLRRRRIFLHVVANAAPTVLAVSGLQIGYLLGGSILVETVFSWPGTGFLLNDAIFRRDIPLLQGVILVLALFFVFMNLLVDILQSLIDPRMSRG